VSSAISRLLILATLIAQLLGSTTTALAANPLDFPIPPGHFYTQANGRGGAGGTGYAVVNATENIRPFGVISIPFFTAFTNFGGVPMLGYPASRLTVFPDFPIQVFQKLVLQFQPGRGIFFLNTFDIMHEHGFDAFLDSVRSIPPPFSTAPDTGLSWQAVVARHQAFLNQDPAIRSVYFSVANPVAEFG